MNTREKLWVILNSKREPRWTIMSIARACEMPQSVLWRWMHEKQATIRNKQYIRRLEAIANTWRTFAG